MVRDGRAPLATAPAESLATFVLVGARRARCTAFNGHVDLGTGIRHGARADRRGGAGRRLRARVRWCWATPQSRPTKGRRSPARRSSSAQSRCGGRQPRPASTWRRGRRRWLAFRPPSSSWRTASSGPARRQRRISYGELIGADRIRLALADDAPRQAGRRAPDRRLLAPRVDLPPRRPAGSSIVHDMRLPGMLHGRVVRPPYAGLR